MSKIPPPYLEEPDFDDSEFNTDFSEGYRQRGVSGFFKLLWHNINDILMNPEDELDNPRKTQWL